MTQEALKLALEFIENSECGTADLEARIKEALREHAMREVQRLGQEIEQEPEYAWPTVADYERDVGFQTNEAFRMAWGMARTTNKMLGHPSQPQQEPFAWFRYQQGSRVYYDTKKWDDCQPLYTKEKNSA